MINLFTCVPDQKVKYRNGGTGAYAGISDGEGPYKFMTRTRYNNLKRHAQSGSIAIRGCHHPYDVVEILPVETPEETPMIDLSTCAPGQKVRFENGQIGFVTLSRRQSGNTEMRSVNTGLLNWSWYTLDGIQGKDLPDPEWRIVEILPVEAPAEPPTVDLSTCAYGQKVEYRNGTTGTVRERALSGSFPYRTKHDCILFMLCHNKEGSHTNLSNCAHDVVKIFPLEPLAEQPMPEPTPTLQEMDYKRAYIEIANIISVAFPECEVCTVDMARLIMHENRTLRMALGLPSYKQVSDAIDDEEME
jgi:hypothetical protein